MVKSMTAAIAGLKAHQTKMDVLGNNIANVNTWGYKSSSTNFQDAMYTNQIAGSEGNDALNGLGGVNTSQMGYGTIVGSISRNFETGSGQFTGNSLDCMIDGTGFFIVGSYNDSISTNLRDTNAFLSRVGILRPDSNGYLVDDSGNYVYGYHTEMDPVTGEITVTDTTTLYPIQIPLKDTQAVDAEGNLLYTDEAGHNILIDENKRYYYIAQNKEYIKVPEDEILYSCRYPNKNGDLTTRPLDKTADGFTFTAAGGELVFLDKDASGRLNGNEVANTHYYVLEKDADGNERFGLELTFNTADNKYYYKTLKNEDGSPKEYTGETDKEHVKGVLEDPDNKGLVLITTAETWKNADGTDSGIPKYAYIAESGMKIPVSDTGDIPVQTGTNPDGSPVVGTSTTDEIAIRYYEAGGHTVDPSTGEYMVEPGEKVMVNKDDVKIVTKTDENGQTVKERYNIATWQIGTDGNIVGVDVDNKIVSIGKLAVASVENPNGLELGSGYYYTIGNNAGQVIAMETTGMTGQFKSNYLEMANVDLASDIATMITTQRGYQANTKIITVTDEMLEQLVSMKR